MKGGGGLTGGLGRGGGAVLKTVIFMLSIKSVPALSCSPTKRDANRIKK